MAIRTVTDAIRYVGADDNTLTLFENQYPVQPMGVSYNSYVILDEKIAVMDSVDARAAEEWLSNVAQVLEGRSPDYLVVTHMEPDHSGSLMHLAQKYPEMKIVGNAKTFTMIKQFFGTGTLTEGRMLEVGEGDTLSLGTHRLRFLLAPMVHWPEVMTAYEETEKILFSADAFGRFGALERTARPCVHPRKHSPCVGDPQGQAGEKRRAGYLVRFDRDRPLLCRDQRILLREAGIGQLHL